MACVGRASNIRRHQIRSNERRQLLTVVRQLQSQFADHRVGRYADFSDDDFGLRQLQRQRQQLAKHSGQVECFIVAAGGQLNRYLPGAVGFEAGRRDADRQR